MPNRAKNKTLRDQEFNDLIEVFNTKDIEIVAKCIGDINNHNFKKLFALFY